MNNPFILGIIGWALPGVGHLLQGKMVRGLIIAAVVWIMFIVAIISGGAYYPGFEMKDGFLLYWLNVFARMGNGLGGVISYIISSTPSKDVAALATFEYGGRFLEVAGLINFLAAIDAADIGIGRKK